jgi:hypothetical protein
MIIDHLVATVINNIKMRIIVHVLINQKEHHIAHNVKIVRHLFITMEMYVVVILHQSVNQKKRYLYVKEVRVIIKLKLLII